MKETIMETVSYKCPNCSAPLSFDIDSQSWNCKFCDSVFTSKDLGRIEALGSSETIKEEEISPAVQAKTIEDVTMYTCPSCGGKIITTPTTAATFCVYCHNPTIIASRLTEQKNQPDFLIPFKLNKETAIKNLQALCKGKLFLPKNFKKFVSDGEISGLYVPYWLFNFEVATSFTARGIKKQSWRSGDYRYTKTDMYNIVRSSEAFFKNIPADGSLRMEDRLMESLEPFNFSQMLDFKMEYLSGHFADIFDADIKTAARKIFSQIYPGVQSSLLKTAKEYTHIEGTNLSLDKKETMYSNVMLPVWVLMAKCEEKKYIFAMNGQTGKISGYLPRSFKLAFIFYLKLSLAISLIFFLGGMLL
jgi:DNA-directed RNA polymerase subunit RPC12/RpoP